MSKKSIYSVLSVLAGCGLLIGGMSYWLGAPSPEPALTDLTDDDTAELVAPLAPEELEAYQEVMTNEQNPVAVVTTNKGTFQLELFGDTMPITTDNFIKLATEGFYNGTKFHRVIDGFMIQGGDPITKTEEYFRYGTGGPGYAIPDEHIAGEYLTNVRGTITMANSGPNSGGSQFFINLVDNTYLDFDKEPLQSKHPVFGRILSGMDVVEAIAKVEVNEQNNLPLDPVIIEKVEIIIKD